MSDLLQNVDPSVDVVAEPTPTTPLPPLQKIEPEKAPVKNPDGPRHPDPIKAQAIANFLFHIRSDREKSEQAGNNSMLDIFHGFTVTGHKVRAGVPHPDVKKSVMDWFEENGFTVDRQNESIHW